MLRCLLVDDNAAFLDAAATLLEREGLDVVGVATSTSEALALVQSAHPEVALVDIALGPESGFDLARALAEVDEGLTVILISTQVESDYADMIAEAPAAGFVAKSDLSARAVRALVNGLPGT